MSAAPLRSSISEFLRQSSSTRIRRWSKHVHAHLHVDWVRVGIVTLHPALRDHRQRRRQPVFPTCSTLFRSSACCLGRDRRCRLPARRPDWEICRRRSRARFLLALILSASMMPVETAAAPRRGTLLRPGLRLRGVRQHSVTGLALKQGGYDWGFLAYAVGFGGTMIPVLVFMEQSAGELGLRSEFGRGFIGSNRPTSWHSSSALLDGTAARLT